MNNIKLLYKTEKEYKRKHNTDYNCLKSLLILYVKFWKYSKDSRHKKSYLRRILNTYIKLIKFNIDNICGYSVNIDNNRTSISHLLTILQYYLQATQISL